MLKKEKVKGNKYYVLKIKVAKKGTKAKYVLSES